MVIEGVSGRRSVDVLPYIVGGTRADALESAGSQPPKIRLDAKYGLTSNVTLDVTVNPDFAQIGLPDRLGHIRVHSGFKEQIMIATHGAGHRDLLSRADAEILPT